MRYSFYDDLDHIVDTPTDRIPTIRVCAICLHKTKQYELLRKYVQLEQKPVFAWQPLVIFLLAIALDAWLVFQAIAFFS